MTYKYLIILFTLLFTSCNKEDFMIETITIASEKAIGIDPSGLSKREYFLIKQKASAKWEYLSQNIQGFEYERGYEYTLKVKVQTIKKPKEDQYSESYILLEVLSKEKKQSENLPI